MLLHPLSRMPAAAANFATFQAELGRLVEVFGRNLSHYKSPGYDEASLRNEFLNPFFRASQEGLEKPRAMPNHGLARSPENLTMKSDTDVS